MYFATNLVGPGQRANAWRDIVHSICGHFSVQFGAGEANGSIETIRIGELSCARISQTVHRIVRAESGIRADPTDHCFLILQTAGHASIAAAANEAAMVPGDAVLLDSAAPFEMTMQGRTSQICVHVPKDDLRRRGVDWSQRPVTKLAPQGGFFVHSLVGAAFAPGEDVLATQGDIMAEAIISLVASSLTAEPSAPPMNRPSERLRQVRNFILNNLGEEDLTPRTIANATAISERQLHRLFEVGPSLSQWIRTARLEHCASDFRNPAMRDRSITEIAFARGFNDCAHFSRVFRDAFGLSPREYRKQVAHAS